MIPTEESITEIAISLHHTHLPKISQLGLIDYEPATHEVEANEIEQALPPELLANR